MSITKEKEKKATSFIIKILIAIVAGSLIGPFLTNHAVTVFLLRLLVTFSDIFTQFLSFFVPIVVLGLTIPSIIELGSKASKMIIYAVIIAYLSYCLSGILSIFVGYTIVPMVLESVKINATLASGSELYTSFVPQLLSPFFDVVGAIVLAFTFGIAASVVKSDSFYKGVKDIERLLYQILNGFVIPMLPIYISCIFAKLSATGVLQQNIGNFAIVIGLIFITANSYLILTLLITAIITKRPVSLVFKSYITPYLVAFGTQSSKATIPVSLEAAEEMDTSKEVREFAVPLLATIHLVGSMVTQTLGAIAIYYIYMGTLIPLPLMLSYIFILATILLAAPGIPGGEAVATRPLLTSFLGFPPGVAETMFTFGIANDSFATSVNVTNDSVVILILDALYKKMDKKNIES